MWILLPGSTCLACIFPSIVSHFRVKWTFFHAENMNDFFATRLIASFLPLRQAFYELCQRYLQRFISEPCWSQKIARTWLRGCLKILDITKCCMYSTKCEYFSGHPMNRGRFSCLVHQIDTNSYFSENHSDRPHLFFCGALVVRLGMVLSEQHWDTHQGDRADGRNFRKNWANASCMQCLFWETIALLSPCAKGYTPMPSIITCHMDSSGSNYC